MARRPGRINLEWETPKDGPFNWEHVAIEVLMDIRAELRTLNRTLSCHRVPRMSDDIHRMEKRLAKHMPLTRGRKK